MSTRDAARARRSAHLPFGKQRDPRKEEGRCRAIAPEDALGAIPRPKGRKAPKTLQEPTRLAINSVRVQVPGRQEGKAAEAVLETRR